jgi:hypothetical protein
MRESKYRPFVNSGCIIGGIDYKTRIFLSSLENVDHKRLVRAVVFRHLIDKLRSVSNVFTRTPI